MYLQNYLEIWLCLYNRLLTSLLLMAVTTLSLAEVPLVSTFTNLTSRNKAGSLTITTGKWIPMIFWIYLMHPIRRVSVRHG